MIHREASRIPKSHVTHTTEAARLRAPLVTEPMGRATCYGRHEHDSTIDAVNASDVVDIGRAYAAACIALGNTTIATKNTVTATVKPIATTVSTA